MKNNYIVLFTKDLNKFRFHEVNRKTTTPISTNRIKAIALSMKENGVFIDPVIITTKGWIIDGQHRVEAARITGKGIYYIVDETIPNTTKGIFDAARKYNQHAKVWGKGDYINGFAVQGNESYEKLEVFRQKFPQFTLTEQLMLMSNSGTNCIDKKDFAEGKFQVKNIKKAEEWAGHLLELKPYFEKGYNKSVFVRTLLTILEKKKEFKFEEFLHKVKLRPGSLYLCGDKRSYSEMIENIYNFKRSNKINLRF